MKVRFLALCILTCVADLMLFDGQNVASLSRYGQTSIDRVLHEIDGTVLGLLG
jgi:hypothetical protein